MTVILQRLIYPGWNFPTFMVMPVRLRHGMMKDTSGLEMLALGFSPRPSKLYHVCKCLHPKLHCLWKWQS